MFQHETWADKFDLHRYLPEESFVARSHGAAIQGGELMPGEEALITVDPDECLSPL